MAYGITVQYASQVTVTETFVLDAAPSPQVVYSAFNTSVPLSATTAVPVTKKAFDTVALVTGAKTLDFTALNDDLLGSIDLTGLKIQIFKLYNLGAAAMTVAKGASNGYTGFGSSFSVVVPPGGEVVFYGAEGAADVSGSVKTIDITGTGTQTFELTVIAG